MKKLSKIIADMPDNEISIPDDIIVHYMVNKNSSDVNINYIITVIKVYVQNNPVYFNTEKQMGFVNGTLVFSIVGEKKDHEELRKILGSDINKLGCKLNWREL